jgi:hypothetical protein
MDRPISSGFGETSASEPNATPSSARVCPHCGQSINSGLEHFLAKLGVSDDAINNLKNSIQNADVEEYLNQARDLLRSKGDKAKSYAKEHPGKVAAGVAVLAVGAGLLISALNRD